MHSSKHKTIRPSLNPMPNLARRRMWFSDGEEGQDAPQNGNDPTPEGRVEELPSWAQTMIRTLRTESAERRVALKKEQEAAQQREQARLQEEGRWKELAEARAAELAKLSPYQQRADTLEGMIRTSNEARINRIPEDMRGLIPVDYPPERLSIWLDTNWERLSAKPAPATDAGAAGSGAGGNGVGSVKLTEAEIAAAKKFGLTPEQYAKHKK